MLSRFIHPFGQCPHISEISPGPTRLRGNILLLFRLLDFLPLRLFTSTVAILVVGVIFPGGRGQPVYSPVNACTLATP